MVKAFVFGKFLPFHKGHAAMIRFALDQCDFLTVLVCASDTESIPGQVRQSWIETTFAGQQRFEVRVFNYSAQALPNTSVASKEVSQAWSEVFRQQFPGYSLVITSEPYGEFVAGFMHIRHIAFDPGRTMVPVSATAVRNNLFANWHFLPAAVKAVLAIKVVILGTESTGKTRLTEDLSSHFHCSKVLEAGRDIIPDSTAFSMDDLYRVASEHARRIDTAVAGDSALVIIDTDIHTTLSYGRFMFGKELTVTNAIYASNRASLYLYLNKDAPYIQDGTRLVQQERNLLDHSHRNVLLDYHIPIIEITGSWKERFDRAVEEIDLLITQVTHYRS